MKLHISILAAAVGCFGLMTTACSDWLDHTPADKQTYEMQFSTPAGFYTSVNGIYNLIAGNNLYGYNLSYGPIDVMGNCYNVTATNSALAEFASASYSGTYASSTLASIWSTAYNAILNANLIIEAIDEHPGVLTDKDAKLIRGEMLALRAFLHLDLTRLFGESIAWGPDYPAVPYADNSEIVRRERLTIAEVIYDHIIPDLTEAQELLEEVDPILTDGVLNFQEEDESNWGRYRQLRMNYYAATLVKARAYIWVEDFDNALIEAVKICDDPHAQAIFPWVEPSKLLANSINPDRIFSTECLFGFYNDKLSDIYDYRFAGTLDPGAALYPVFNYDAKLFDNVGDYRLQSQWGPSAATHTNLDFIKYKGFKASTSAPEFWASFYGMMRISEAYLIAAECYQSKRDVDNIRKYLNPVRVARGNTEFPANSNPFTLLKQIKLEYCREFRGEGQIYFLHKRNWQSFTTASGNGDLDGSGWCTSKDNPAADVRYSVPVPAAENY